MASKSDVWKYFIKTNEKDQAKCNICGKILACKGSTTTSMKYHLKRHRHGIQNQNEKTSDNNSTSYANATKNSTTGTPNLFNFVTRISLECILSKCASLDGFSIRQICRSEAITGYVTFKGFDMPKSKSTVWKLILTFFNE